LWEFVQFDNSLHQEEFHCLLMVSMTKQRKDELEIILILPSLSVSGGVLEAISLAEDCQKLGCRLLFCVMWRSDQEVPIEKEKVVRLSSFLPSRRLALIQFPFIFLRFMYLWLTSGLKDRRFIFTHFATLPFLAFVNQRNAFAFVQGVEWTFHKGQLLSLILKRFIIFCYMRCSVITASKYLTENLEHEGIAVFGSAEVWGSPDFLVVNSPVQRGVDIVMIVSPGFCKRPDLYFDSLQWFTEHHPDLKVVLITNDSFIRARAESFDCKIEFQPGGRDKIKDILLNAKVFLHLSESEGLALPPLEAIGCGCIPICRDSGGPRSYMLGPLQRLIFPLFDPVDSLCAAALDLLNSPNEREMLRKAGLVVFRDGLVRRAERHTLLASVFAK